MIRLLRFVLVILASPFKSKSRLEAENAVLRHQLIILQRKMRGPPRPTHNDRWFLFNMGRSGSGTMVIPIPAPTKVKRVKGSGAR
jgi:hypothetical protein